MNFIFSKKVCTKKILMIGFLYSKRRSDLMKILFIITAMTLNLALHAFQDVPEEENSTDSTLVEEELTTAPEEEPEIEKEEPYAEFYTIINRPESVPLTFPWELYKIDTLRENKDFHGWCIPEKALKMMELIYQTKSKVCVEIGVFGGKSIHPTASALKYLGAGVIFAIDPWSPDECAVGYDPNDPNCQWWKEKSQLEFIYNDFKEKMVQKEVSDFCVTMPMTSEKALSMFPDESIDILHIDGNHTELVSLKDVQMYLPKVKKNGYIWFDDVNWSSTHAALKLLYDSCEKDLAKSTETCFLFKKPDSEE